MSSLSGCLVCPKSYVQSYCHPYMSTTQLKSHVKQTANIPHIGASHTWAENRVLWPARELPSKPKRLPNVWHWYPDSDRLYIITWQDLGGGEANSAENETCCSLICGNWQGLKWADCNSAGGAPSTSTKTFPPFLLPPTHPLKYHHLTFPISKNLRMLPFLCNNTICHICLICPLTKRSRKKITPRCLGFPWFLRIPKMI